MDKIKIDSHILTFVKISALVTLLMLVVTIPDVLAQCPMCRSAAESNLKAGGGNGRGLNAGILYMLAAPYILVSTLGILWYRKYRKNQEDSGEPV